MQDKILENVQVINFLVVPKLEYEIQQLDPCITVFFPIVGENLSIKEKKLDSANKWASFMRPLNCRVFISSSYSSWEGK